MKQVIITLLMVVASIGCNAQTFGQILGKDKESIKTLMSAMDMRIDESGYGYDNHENCAYITYEPNNKPEYDITCARLYIDQYGKCFSLDYFFMKSDMPDIIESINKNYAKIGDGVWLSKDAKIMLWMEYKLSTDFGSVEFRLTTHPHQRDDIEALSNLMFKN